MILSVLASVAVLAAIVVIVAALVFAETTLVYIALGLAGVSALLLVGAILAQGRKGADRTDGLGKSSVPTASHVTPEHSERVPAPAPEPVREAPAWNTMAEDSGPGEPEYDLPRWQTPTAREWPEPDTTASAPAPAPFPTAVESDSRVETPAETASPSWFSGPTAAPEPVEVPRTAAHDDRASVPVTDEHSADRSPEPQQPREPEDDPALSAADRGMPAWLAEAYDDDPAESFDTPTPAGDDDRDDAVAAADLYERDEPAATVTDDDPPATVVSSTDTDEVRPTRDEDASETTGPATTDDTAPEAAEDTDGVPTAPQPDEADDPDPDEERRGEGGVTADEPTVRMDEDPSTPDDPDPDEERRGEGGAAADEPTVRMDEDPSTPDDPDPDEERTEERTEATRTEATRTDEEETTDDGASTTDDEEPPKGKRFSYNIPQRKEDTEETSVFSYRTPAEDDEDPDATAAFTRERP
ncbi:hypothetical protein [Nocardiopsis lambiniae]|uniref:Uncharacterized protein n=1 Tax=Nocardiopsis lambiniae TaxID=3075539 RepID=A0ABU2M3R5_9ACTN|nr:hypothetical protein [Nocardiopsis sp. DSM 44743]MDT0327234.1 hypothetical protein [Nocardiopsis sp. DSM 44743]